MIHLTLTGYHAGATLCGASRNETDKYVHVVYAPTAWINGENPEVCSDCLKVWHDTDEED